jgi:hypothetical protein
MRKKPTSKVTKTGRVPKKPRLKVDKSPKCGIHLGLEYESFCELSCIFFAEELMKLGYVDRIERSPSYLLCDPVQHTYVEQMKKASKSVTQTIARGVSYTPDFDIYFTSKALGVFCWEYGCTTKWDNHLFVVQLQPDGTYRGCMEVKPDFQRNSTTPKSVQSMRWLMQKHNVYCNLFRPNRIFEGLFVPDKYLLTERGTPRLLKFKPLTLQQYINGTTRSAPVSKGASKGKRGNI